MRSGAPASHRQAAAELLPHNQEARRVVERAWDALRVALRGALMRAQAQGELPESADPAALADLLFVVLQGLRLVAKTGDADVVLAAAEQALGLLRTG